MIKDVRRWRLLLALGLLLLAAAGASFARATVAPPTPGVVAGGFCTYDTDYFAKSAEAAQRIDHYFTRNIATGALLGEIFDVGGGHANVYTWKPTGQQVTLEKVKPAIQVDEGVAALRQAVGTGGPPGALSTSAENPTDMGTGGDLGAQALALKINQGFSEAFVTPATGFSGLSLLNMEGLKLGGAKLTPAQASALNGQATLQVRDASDAALGAGTVPYGLSFKQLTDLIGILNGSFDSCGGPSKFAQAHLYQPYLTSNAFSGQRPSTVSDFAFKPAYNTFSGQVVPVAPETNGTRIGCEASRYAGVAGKIALIERGVCTFNAKVQLASDAGAIGAIIFNSTPETGGTCPAYPTPGSIRCEALVGMGGATPVAIPAAFVQRSTGLALRDGTAPVTVFVQQ
jgi:hypothetical protein